ncbi:MAG: hypothetical protein LUC97_04285 [Clostridiales bacterium]|nr:hypothetical protein [Clostridiales bacterium]MCD8214850.1 hypothetical protein [Clostridiales bacterium]
MKNLKKIISYGGIGAVVLLALYIMKNGLGLAEGLDFGAGAYYYADIPNFESIVNTNVYTSPVPMWVLILLFLIWGFLMYKLWQFVAGK